MAKDNLKRKKKKGSGLFFIIVVLLALLVISLVFLINKNQIVSNYKDTGFFDKLFGVTPEFVENHEEKPSETTGDKMSEEEIIISLKSDNTVKEIEELPPPAEEKTSPVVKNDSKPTTNEPSQTKSVETPKVEKKADAVEKPVEQPKKTATTDLQLCFVYISPEGAVMRQMVKRTVTKNDSPLTTAINLILRGPDTTLAAEKNLTSLIPAGTKLLGAKVQDGVAYLNFSSDFERNSFGVDGYNAQLMQVVYTASAFSTVNSVQFLVEGEKLAYLSEGIWIGSPLSKNSF